MLLRGNLSAPLILNKKNMPFLTLEDPNAKITGSRDPLGHVPVWDTFARRFIGNLTTASGSVRGFTTLMLGHYLVEEYFEEGRIDNIQEQVLPLVLRLEQLCAYAQVLANRQAGLEDNVDGIRGITRVKEALKDKVVVIDTNRDGYILSDQKVYGLWGLYSVASRSSKLINADRPGVTQEAKSFIDVEYRYHLDAVWEALAKLLLRGGQVKVRPRADAVVRVFVDIMGPVFTNAEVTFYNMHLCQCAGENHEQALLSSFIGNHLTDYERLDRSYVSLLQQESAHASDYLGGALEDILVLEPLLLASERLFSLLSQSNGQSLKAVAAIVKGELGDRLDLLANKPFTELLPLIQKAYPDGSQYPVAKTMAVVHAALSTGDFLQALQGVLDWNRYVMALRASEPWVKISDMGKIDVRYRSNELSIGILQDLEDAWKNSYFISSLVGVHLQLHREAVHVS